MMPRHHTLALAATPPASHPRNISGYTPHMSAAVSRPASTLTRTRSLAGIRRFTSRIPKASSASASPPTRTMASEGKSISSYLPADTHKGLQPGDGDLTYLHTMLRVSDLGKTVEFFTALGLMETRRKESDAGKFTLVFLASAPGAPEIELTYNWGGEEFAPPSRSMGHLAYATDDIYKLCASLQGAGVVINRPPRDGKMAFVKSPDGISVELLQKGEALDAAEPWASMANVGEW